ncbi:MAG TPA: hypothetical protein VFP87_12745, partial [Chitinophagaceae bacterium]|nr:hypothetical protein [Chitinophagaceae bacterium]
EVASLRLLGSFKFSIMKKILFFLIVSMLVISCTKEMSSMYVDNRPKDSSFINVEYKPMPKAAIPSEIPNY